MPFSLKIRSVRDASLGKKQGAGTFKPVEDPDLGRHAMHSERLAVSAHSLRALRDAALEGRPIVAVGTTAARETYAGAPEACIYVYIYIDRDICVGALESLCALATPALRSPAPDSSTGDAAIDLGVVDLGHLDQWAAGSPTSNVTGAIYNVRYSLRLVEQVSGFGRSIVFWKATDKSRVKSRSSKSDWKRASYRERSAHRGTVGS